ncbi:MAG: hypothetical protein V1798_05925 [Pseudomonadota bacterium]
MAGVVDISPAIDALVNLSNSAAVVSWEQKLGSTLFLSSAFFADGGPLDQFSVYITPVYTDYWIRPEPILKQSVPFGGARRFKEVIRRANTTYTLQAFRSDMRTYAVDLIPVANTFLSIAQSMFPADYGIIPNQYLRNSTSGDVRLGRADMYFVAANLFLSSALIRQETFYQFGSGTLRSLADEKNPQNLANRLNAFVGQLDADLDYRRQAGSFFRQGLETYIAGLGSLNTISLTNSQDPRASAAVDASRDIINAMLTSYVNHSFVSIPHAKTGSVSANFFNLFDGNTPDGRPIAYLPFVVEAGKLRAVELFWDSFLANVVQGGGAAIPSLKVFRLGGPLFNENVLRGLASRLGALRIANRVVYQSTPYVPPSGGGAGGGSSGGGMPVHIPFRMAD